MLALLSVSVLSPTSLSQGPRNSLFHVDGVDESTRLGARLLKSEL